jgi:hypothetical protein
MTEMAEDGAPAGAARLLMVETRSPWESGDVADFLGLVDSLLRSGAEVHLHLIQNGVLWLQRDAAALSRRKQEFGERLRLSCDDLSLDLRGIPHAEMAQHVEVQGIDELMCRMLNASVKTIWHS